MKKPITKSTATISIATLVVVFVVAIGLILASNYRKNNAAPKSVPIHATTIEVNSRLTNSQNIDKPYLIDSATGLKQELKLNSLTGFDPISQVLAGVVTAGNSGVTLDSTATINNQVLINYRTETPEAGQTPTELPHQLFVTFDRVVLPNFSSVSFVFTNLTAGATQTISKSLGAE
ncbi:hypothetical protein JXA59_02270 [Patescibacteria group bacterium]|nr:hypothetical protein [Patescibacteria group bacterium]